MSGCVHWFGMQAKCITKASNFPPLTETRRERRFMSVLNKCNVMTIWCDVNMRHMKNLWWMVGWAQAVLRCLAEEAWMRLVERVRLAVLILFFFFWVLKARQVDAAAASRASDAAAATWGVAEPGDGAGWDCPAIWVHQVICAKQPLCDRGHCTSSKITTMLSIISIIVIFLWSVIHYKVTNNSLAPYNYLITKFNNSSYNCK